MFHWKPHCGSETEIRVRLISHFQPWGFAEVLTNFLRGSRESEGHSMIPRPISIHVTASSLYEYIKNLICHIIQSKRKLAEAQEFPKTLDFYEYNREEIRQVYARLVI